MNAIDSLFPRITTTSILCRWHITKNVVAHCKGAFETGEEWETFLTVFNTVMNSVTKTEYDENISVPNASVDIPQSVKTYVLNTWFNTWKEKLFNS